MSYRALEWAMEVTLAPATKMILVVLAWHADDDGICWPSVSTIARKSGSSTRTVRRAIKTMVNQGVMEIRPGYERRGRQTSNTYRLSVDKAPDNLSPLGVTECQGEGDTAVSPLELTEEVKKEVGSRPVDKCGGAAGQQPSGAKLYPETPEALRSGERALVARLLDEVSEEDAVLLIDELSGALRAGAISGSPVRWFEGLLRKYRMGKFEQHYTFFETVDSKGEKLRVSRNESLEGRLGFLKVKEKLVSGD
ncbi:helix-turn-helix domain-containing protein [Chromohalobacter sp. 296-RDG]|uniref:helix-turn-helix domain-containing protein n=1 Tax=Chromohalobacter sp. 296-RDG TaxID=2994062 RepID=UPI00246824D2|nr:helix-turn-helix domain-containing protein [Chromohalobacter sp. 296-RDG]